MELMERRTDEWTDEWMEGMERRTDKLMDERMDGRMNVWKDRMDN